MPLSYKDISLNSLKTSTKVFAFKSNQFTSKELGDLYPEVDKILLNMGLVDFFWSI